MALTTPGSVKDSYKDVVQLEQSGAGLPSHAGKQAALYDGAGNQILGRTAQPSWLDPDPNASGFADTIEFSTMADKTQGQLESDGWTFTNSSGTVSNGVFVQTSANGTRGEAYKSLSSTLTGDFDILICRGWLTESDFGSDPGGGVGFADTSGNTAIMGYAYLTEGTTNARAYTIGSYSTWGSVSFKVAKTLQSGYVILRFLRLSGTIYVSGSNIDTCCLFSDGVRTPTLKSGFAQSHSGADTANYNRLVVSGANANTKDIPIFWIRRFL